MTNYKPSIRRVSNKLLWQLKIKGNKWDWDPYYYRKTITNKGINIMKNRGFIIGLALVGLSMQVFPLICSGALKQGYIDGFNSASIITLFATVILAVWSQRSTKEHDNVREDIYRDIDAIYRHIDDCNRDTREDLREEIRHSCESTCKTSCGKK